jgi:Zn ribbon nucleic-acid-binding protein
MSERQWSPRSAEAYEDVKNRASCPTCRTCDDENSWVEKMVEG